ncbi:MAG TPA: hydroxymethylbilane synthase [Egibacteraceae bacterium]|nr:hydroxymethylbilane synthase [Egibacteraceae bacterium]
MLRIATRRSALARAQALAVGRLLQERTGRPFELVAMAATGDLHPGRAVGAFDSKGLFVDTLRQAVLDGDCALAVHSYKDLPTEPVAGLVIGAVPPREDPRDVLVTVDGSTLDTLPPAAAVGTSSARRRLQLLAARLSLRVQALRGNLDTRLRRVADGDLGAVVVAAAGLRRLYPDRGAGALGLQAVALAPDECLPAPAQGALAVECRAGDAETLSLCARIDDASARRQVRAERAFLAALGGGCLAPVGALCQVAGSGQLQLAGLLADPSSSQVLRRSLRDSDDRPEQRGAALAEQVVAAGGAQVLAAIAELRRAQAGGVAH